MSKVDQLVETSKEVLEHCSLENGALVAANTDKDYYPRNVQNYRFVWPRDAAFTLRAAQMLGLGETQNSFLDWLMDRAEEFSDTGKIYHRYLTNGARDPQSGHQYQPDQAGALIWSLSQDTGKKEETVIKLLAEGLCSNWDTEKECFKVRAYDLWEERRTIPKFRENFTYSLAACSKGLSIAGELTGEKKYIRAADQMAEVLQTHGEDYYPRSKGKFSDDRIDASILGLAWPFDVVEKDQKLDNSVEMIEEKLMTTNGIMRYQNDMYEGMLVESEIVQKGAGGWPLITFWYVKALSKLGRKKEAEQVFKDYLGKLPDSYLPEQVFDSEDKTAVTGLAWSHAMFVIAAEELGYI